jgi:prevent-host-death family protein
MLCTILASLFKASAMGFSTGDVVPFTKARAKLSELADQAKAGAERIITKNGERYVALIDANRLGYYYRLERERIHLLLIDDARRALADITAGRTFEADGAIERLQQRRTATAPAKSSVAGKPARKRG